MLLHFIGIRGTKNACGFHKWGLPEFSSNNRCFCFICLSSSHMWLMSADWLVYVLTVCVRMFFIHSNKECNEFHHLLLENKSKEGSLLLSVFIWVNEHKFLLEQWTLMKIACRPCFSWADPHPSIRSLSAGVKDSYQQHLCSPSENKIISESKTPESFRVPSGNKETQRVFYTKVIRLHFITVRTGRHASGGYSLFSCTEPLAWQ